MRKVLTWLVVLSSIAILATALASPLWLDIYTVSAGKVWEKTGWSMFAWFAGFAVFVYRHKNDDSKTRQEQIVTGLGYIKSAEFLIPSLMVYLMFLVFISIEVPRKLASHVFEAERERSLQSEQAKEIDRLRNNPPAARFISEDKELRDQWPSLTNEIARLTSENNLLKEQNRSLEEITSAQTLFEEIQAAAKNGSRTNFTLLRQVGTNSGPQSATARSIESQIIASLVRYRTSDGGAEVIVFTDSRTGRSMEAREMPLREQLPIMERTDAPQDAIIGIMRTLRDRPKADLLSVSTNALAKSDSLRACAAICGVLSDVYGRKYDFLNFEEWRSFAIAESAKEPQ